MDLPQHWAQVSHLPEQPAQHIRPALFIRRQELSGFFGEIKQDRTGFKQRQRLSTASGFMVDDGGNPVIGGNIEERRIKLLSSADVDRYQVIGQARLFQKNGDLVSVRRVPVV